MDSSQRQYFHEKQQKNCIYFGRVRELAGWGCWWRRARRRRAQLSPARTNLVAVDPLGLLRPVSTLFIHSLRRALWYSLLEGVYMCVLYYIYICTFVLWKTSPWKSRAGCSEALTHVGLFFAHTSWKLMLQACYISRPVRSEAQRNQWRN